MDGDSTRDDASREVSVFLSYSRPDRARARQVLAVAEAAGCRVWWDGLLEGGVAFANTTENELERADVVLVVWSATAIGSHWVRDEATRGRDLGRLVPVSIDGVLPPLGFRQFQVLDLSNWHGAPDAPEAQALIRAIHIAARLPDTPITAARGRVPDRNRRAALIGGGAAVLLAGGGLAAWRSGMFGAGAVVNGSAVNSIAVLRFRNLSGDADEDYFSDGLSEEIRATLVANALLKVAAPVSTDAFGRSDVQATDIARKLGVAYLLYGSIRRSGDVLRIAATLIDGASGFTTWNRSFDRKLSDVFAIQSEIAATVADVLTAQMVGAGVRTDRTDQARSHAGSTTNVAAFDAYLRGKAIYNGSASEADDRAALARFDAAINLDADYAAAYAARARVLIGIANSYAVPQDLAGLKQAAVAAAQTAVRLAPGSADAQSTLGAILFQGLLDPKAARAPFERSFALGSGDAAVLTRFAFFSARTGRFALADRAAGHAMTLDPLNPLQHRAAGLIAYAARRYSAAIPPLRQALLLNPKITGAHETIAYADIMLGKLGEARAEITAEPQASPRLAGLAIIDRKLGRHRDATAALNELVATLGDSALYQQAQVAAQWGEVDAALGLLDRARAAGDAGLIYFRNDPLLDPLRHDPRFGRLLKQLGYD